MQRYVIVPEALRAECKSQGLQWLQKKAQGVWSLESMTGTLTMLAVTHHLQVVCQRETRDGPNNSVRAVYMVCE